MGNYRETLLHSFVQQRDEKTEQIRLLFSISTRYGIVNWIMLSVLRGMHS